MVPSQLSPLHSHSSSPLDRRTSRPLWTRLAETQILPHSTLTASSILLEPQPTQSKSSNLSSSASSSEPRSTTRNSTKIPQLPTQELSGPAASPSQSHPLPQAPSTTSRSTVLMHLAPPSGP